MKLILPIAALLILCVIAGCGGGGGGTTVPVPETHPFQGTWKMVDGNATLVVSGDGTATVRTTDNDGRWVTFTGSVSTDGALSVTGHDSSGVGVRVWATFIRDDSLLHADSLNMAFDNDPGAWRSYPDVSFRKT